MFIIERNRLTCISKILSNFENDQAKIVTATQDTDRQTDKQTHTRNEPTYLRFSQVIKEREMTLPVGCHKVPKAGFRVFKS